VARLDYLVAGQKAAVEQLATRHERREATAGQLFEESRSLQRSASRLAVGLEEYRNDLDGILRPPVSGRTAARLRQPPVTPSTRGAQRQDMPSLGPQL
jgi:hypothetical protein